MAADDLIEMEGTIEEVYPGGTFLVKTEHGNNVQAHLAGKLRRYRIRVVLGERSRLLSAPMISPKVALRSAISSA